MVSLEDIKMLIKEGYSAGTAGQKTITADGTPERITDQFKKIAFVIVKALSTNTGLAFVSFDEHTKSGGFELTAKEEIPIPIDDLSKIWIDVAVAGEGICYMTFV